jgi:molybdopterin molybdotransferase
MFKMDIEIQLTTEPIDASTLQHFNTSTPSGAWLEFRGVVRGEENGQPISALEYEAYPEMAEREMRRILELLSKKFPCLAAKVIHRIGIIPVGETAIYVGVSAKHRGEAIALLAAFMDQLKQDVPIWKRRVVPLTRPAVTLSPGESAGVRAICLSFEEAISEIQSHCRPLPAVRVSLEEAIGRILRETVCATGDLPDNDRSTRDGYAILKNDASAIFQIVDTVHAADWKPRQLKPGEAVRVATGASLPCENLRVVMQENVERTADTIRIVKPESNPNIRKRGEDMKAGQSLVQPGERLDAGKLALLATVGCARPLVNPRLRVMHFTTGDEIVSPEQSPEPGQIRDSNSILIRALLKRYQCELKQQHLPENFDAANKLIESLNWQPLTSNFLLVSGGASVGDKDFTRALIEHLGYQIVFNKLSLRPGAPLIFGVSGDRIAFGLPGNPLSHFVCFHLFVAHALARLCGAEPQRFLRGKLATKLEDAPCPRETFWPAQLESGGNLQPLQWASSGDVTCLGQTNALIRSPANQGSIEAGSEVDFFPITDSLGM